MKTVQKTPLYTNLEFMNPGMIEQKSFEIINSLLGNHEFSPLCAPIVKRIIHTTGDLEYADLVEFSEGAVESGLGAIAAGSAIVTDTMMAAAGINKRVLALFGGSVACYMSDVDVAQSARERGSTRACASMEKAVHDPHNRIFAIGNAPTALIRLADLIDSGTIAPALVIGVPVGFVNVVEAKRRIKETGIPWIVTNGRKGGSTVAAATINAFLYMLRAQREGTG
jgi:precorrin-8X/cobalt-precorrin-8 methylmutase